MRYLMDYSRRESVSTVIDRAMEFEIAHGATVGLDHRWLALWRLRQSMTSSDWKDLDRSLRDGLEWPERMFGIPPGLHVPGTWGSEWGSPFPPSPPRQFV